MLSPRHQMLLGISPLSWLCSRRKSSIFLSCSNISGISPVGCCNARVEISPNSGGTVDQEKVPDLMIKKTFSNTPPASWLRSKHMILSCFSWPNSFGSEPVSWFSPSQSFSKAPSCESSWPLQIQASIKSVNLLHP